MGVVGVGKCGCVGTGACMNMCVFVCWVGGGVDVGDLRRGGVACMGCMCGYVYEYMGVYEYRCLYAHDEAPQRCITHHASHTSYITHAIHHTHHASHTYNITHTPYQHVAEPARPTAASSPTQYHP